MRVLERLPPWPARFPRTSRTLTSLLLPKLSPDDLALACARGTGSRAHAIKNSGTTGTWTELMWSNSADFTAVNTTAAEASIIAGLNDQPTIPALFFFNKLGRYRTISLLLRGILGTTGTPTITFQVRLGTTAGSSFLSGTSVGVSAAITTSSGVTNKWWELRLDLTCNTPGIGTGNCTLSGAGYVTSPGGFAAPYTYALEPSTPDTATWTSAIDGSLTQYLNVSATWSASSASNTITTKQCLLAGLN